MEISCGPVPTSSSGPEQITDAAVALEVRPGEAETYPRIVEQVAYMLVEHNPWGCKPCELPTASEEDSVPNRAIGFWRRHGADLGAHADAIESRVVAEGWIRTAASNPIDDPAQFVAALSDPRRTRFRPASCYQRIETRANGYSRRSWRSRRTPATGSSAVWQQWPRPNGAASWSRTRRSVTSRAWCSTAIAPR
jgi:hypothetical protein